MAFSTQRGRPRRPTEPATDCGTPELRMKHALGLTAEPIDLCLSRALISTDQHWCGLHLRWLYTLRYGAPSLTTRYGDTAIPPPPAQEDAAQWRTLREQEYHEAVALLQQQRRYEPVMRLCIFNELAPFLSYPLRKQAAHNPALAARIHASHQALSEGLSILVQHWRPTSARGRPS